jgi:hypothetical protein
MRDGTGTYIRDCDRGLHDWVRCPDRDSLKGQMVDRQGVALTKLYTQVVLVFFCRQCLATETRLVDVNQ